MSNMKVVCPNCHKLLTVASQPGIEGKTLICPSCQFKAKFSVFMNGASAQGAHGTGNDDTVMPGWATGGGAQHPVKTNPGRIRVVQTGQIIPLTLGHHTIGRIANPPRATIMIGSAANSDEHMSRCHLELDIVNGPTGMQHRLKDLGKNPSKLNGKEIPKGLIPIWNIGDTVTIGKTDLILEDDDPESTRVDF